jgi:hypothetical protein
LTQVRKPTGRQAWREFEGTARRPGAGAGKRRAMIWVKKRTPVRAPKCSTGRRCPAPADPEDTTMAHEPVNTDAPLTNFSHCHDGILAHLGTFGELPALLGPAARARQIAEDIVDFFRAAVYEHHAEEERELFPAVMASSQPGEEREKVANMVKWLTQEHRDVEHLWARLEPQLKKLAKGQAADLDGSAIEHLVTKYTAHARFEEDEFLPLAETILGRNSNHMAALGLSLHMRHAKPFIGHI